MWGVRFGAFGLSALSSVRSSSFRLSTFRLSTFRLSTFRTSFLRACIFGMASSLGLTTAGCFPEPRGGESSPEIRTIILISVDTLRADHLGLYGHHRFTSPVLDAFSAQGVVFDDASATAPWTLPPHASMLTGLFPLGHGVTDAETALSEEVGTLASWFGEAGWDTAAVVNAIWLKRENYGLTRDFQKYLSVENPDYSRRASSTWVTDQAIQWISDQDERPLFLFVHYYDVHADYASLPEYERLLVSPYEGLADGSAWQIEKMNFAEEHIAHCLRDFDADLCQFGSSEKPLRIDASMQRVVLGSNDIEHLEELYDAGIRQLDSEIGRLLGFLDETRRSEDSLVVITSDHGEEFMEHGRLGHFLTTHQESLRVPLLMRGPGIPAGIRVAAPVSSVDLAPTLLALGSLELPTAVDGLDLSRLWSDREPGPFASRYLYGEASGGLGRSHSLPGIYPLYRSVRQGRFKLVRRSLGSQIDYELFDLAQDPNEQRDIAHQEPDRFAALLSELERRQRSSPGSGPKGAEVELEASEIDQLRALGYAP